MDCYCVIVSLCNKYEPVIIGIYPSKKDAVEHVKKSCGLKWMDYLDYVIADNEDHIDEQPDELFIIDDDLFFMNVSNDLIVGLEKLITDNKKYNNHCIHHNGTVFILKYKLGDNFEKSLNQVFEHIV